MCRPNAAWEQVRRVGQVRGDDCSLRRLKLEEAEVRGSDRSVKQRLEFKEETEVRGNDRSSKRRLNLEEIEFVEAEFFEIET